MVKVTLDMDTFKALASDTRLDILRTLDGKKMSLKDISTATKLNKATLHEHLSKLNEAGLIKKKGREGHKWVYYKLSWKGECLLHPENTRVVVLFSATFVSLFFGIVQLTNFLKGKIVGLASTFAGADTTHVYVVEEEGFHLLPGAAAPASLKLCADVPVYNQTWDMLSQALNENATIKGLAGNTFSNSDIQWTANGVDKVFNYANIAVDDAMRSGVSEADALLEHSSSTPVMLAIVQDPTLLYIAIGCLILFIVLISISTWRLWKNKTPKL